MCHIGRTEVVRIHLFSKLGNWGVDEQGRVRAASTAPDDVGWSVAVERSGFRYDSFGF